MKDSRTRAPRWVRQLSWWAQDYRYAVLWQARSILPGASFPHADPRSSDPRHADAERLRTGDKTPIVVIPGVFESWRFMQPVITAMHRRGHPVHVIAPLRRNSRPVADAARQVDAYLNLHALNDVVIAAHSKGGLVGKYVMTFGSAAERVRGMVAVAAPFAGSRYARLMVAPSLRIFSPTDATILALARDEAVNSRIVSIYGQFDPHIPGGSELVGAKNVQLDTGGHFRVLAHPRVISELSELAR